MSVELSKGTPTKPSTVWGSLLKVLVSFSDTFKSYPKAENRLGVTFVSFTETYRKLTEVTPKSENRLGVTSVSFRSVSVQLSKVTPKPENHVGVTLVSFNETYESYPKPENRLGETSVIPGTFQ